MPCSEGASAPPNTVLSAPEMPWDVVVASGQGHGRGGEKSGLLHALWAVFLSHIPHWPLIPTSNLILPLWPRSWPEIWSVWEHGTSLLFSELSCDICWFCWPLIPHCGSLLYLPTFLPTRLCLNLGFPPSEKSWAKSLSVGSWFWELTFLSHRKHVTGR